MIKEISRNTATRVPVPFSLSASCSFFQFSPTLSDDNAALAHSDKHTV
jgi:hypothetical protein